MLITTEERFMRHVMPIPESGCWMDARNKEGPQEMRARYYLQTMWRIAIVATLITGKLH